MYVGMSVLSIAQQPYIGLSLNLMGVMLWTQGSAANCFKSFGRTMAVLGGFLFRV